MTDIEKLKLAIKAVDIMLAMEKLKENKKLLKTRKLILKSLSLDEPIIPISLPAPIDYLVMYAQFS
jgi:hypothetical protein